MTTERNEKSTPQHKPEKDAPTTDQRIDLEAVFDGDESSLAQAGDTDAPKKPERPGKSRH